MTQIVTKITGVAALLGALSATPGAQQPPMSPADVDAAKKAVTAYLDTYYRSAQWQGRVCLERRLFRA